MAPPRDVYNIDWEVVVSKKQCKVVVGVSVRDWKGDAMATVRMNRSSFPDPLLDEIFVALKATKFGIELGLQKFIFELHALQVNHCYQR